MADMLISKEDQLLELRGSHATRQRDEDWLEACDGWWVRPWAVRAVNGHSTNPNPRTNSMDLDADKFAISTFLSLLNKLGGAFHATSCNNLFSIMEKGILP